MAEYRSTLLSDYVVDTGAADAYVITPVPAISAYATGQIFTFKAVHANTTTSTLNVNGKGATTIKKVGGGTNLAANDILAGQIVFVEYDGTNFQMLNPPAVTLPAISSSNINEFIGTTDGATFSFQRPFDYQSFTSSGTWTKPTNLSGNEMVKVQVWGAGGGGGGTGAANRAAGGGGGGGYSENIYRASDLSATVTVTIGAGGAGGSAGDNDGVAGGATTFGAFMGGGGGGLGRKGSVATGGTGGAAMSQVGAQIFAGGVAGAVQDGIGGSSTYGGGGGGAGTDNNTTGTGGIGGLSYFGCGGGGGGSVDTTGGAGGVGRTGYGGTGGAGGAASAGGVAATTIGAGGGGGGGGTVAGGAGFRGECRVWVFF